MGLDGHIEVLPESKVDEDRAGRLSTSRKKWVGKGSTVQRGAGNLGHRSGFKAQLSHWLCHLKQVTSDSRDTMIPHQ